MSKFAAILLSVGVVALVGTLSYMHGQTSAIHEVNERNFVGFTDTHEVMFKAWMKQNQISYPNWAEYQQRFKIWLKHWEIVEKHNSEPHSFTMTMNYFADLENDEFKELFVGYAPSPRYDDDGSDHVVELPTDSLPDSVDWTHSGAVTEVKNQGSCGSCWAFSTTGALEGLYFLKNGALKSFSEQQLVDCSGAYGNQGCNGGEMEAGFQYVAKYGIETESDYPYQGTDDKCAYDSSKVVFKNLSYNKVPSKKPLQLKAAVTKQPVSVGVDGGSLGFQLYHSGVISILCGHNLDHGVLAVGFGSHHSWLFGNKDTWKIKNSWGPGWGRDGYALIERSDDDGDGECGIAVDASYPTAD